MKRLSSILIVLSLLLCLSPAAFAQTVLVKPSAGQMIYIPAANSEDYAADFYRSALTDAQRDGDDLCLFFPNARLVLRDFFSTRERNRRVVTFKDGSDIGAGNFDSDGQFTGTFSGGLEISRFGAAAKAGPEQDAPTLSVTKNRSGTVISFGTQSVYGALRANLLAAMDGLIALGDEAQSRNIDLTVEFERGEDDSVTAVCEEITDSSGLTAVNIRPQTVWLTDTATLTAVSAGRSEISFVNGLGDVLEKLSVRVTAGEDGILSIQCECPSCGKNQGSALHMLPCGHYTCSPGFVSGEHSVPECGYAGHCVTDSKDHGLCKNCLKPLCNGTEHGFGVCLHEHSWVQQSYKAPSAAADGESVSKCSTCGIIYSQVLPRRG